jgi:hypothetical protein
MQIIIIFALQLLLPSRSWIISGVMTGSSYRKSDDVINTFTTWNGNFPLLSHGHVFEMIGLCIKCLFYTYVSRSENIMRLLTSQSDLMTGFKVFESQRYNEGSGSLSL